MKTIDQVTVALAWFYHDPSNVQIDNDGRVTCDVDPMPGTNQAGNIFAGYMQEILDDYDRDAQYRETAGRNR